MIEKRSKLENKEIKCVFIGYGAGVEGCKLWDPKVQKVLYNTSVTFKEMKPSTIDLQPEKEEKQKEVVQILPTLKKDELHTLVGPDDEESSSSSKSSKEEETQVQPLRRSTRVRQQP